MTGRKQELFRYESYPKLLHWVPGLALVLGAFARALIRAVTELRPYCFACCCLQKKSCQGGRRHMHMWARADAGGLIMK